MNKIEALFQHLWSEYTNNNYHNDIILRSFEKREKSKIKNDHIALRTIKSISTGIDSVSKVFIDLGYEKKDFYEFKEKKLNAHHFEHPDDSYPKIFISELKIDELSSFAQKEAKKMIKAINTTNLTSSKTHWKRFYSTYKKLYKESEYLAWFYVYGFIPNHFTVSVNDLLTFNNLNEVNQFVEDLGYPLNDSGGKIKGSKEQGLEQSSTVANKVKISFIDGEYLIPSCFYEFALRHNNFKGFIASSADKIFDSTN